MKKLFILFISLFLCLGAFAQDFENPQTSDSYPLSEIKNDGKLSWVIDYVYCTKKYTYVHITNTVILKRPGTLTIPGNTRLYVNDKAYSIRGWLVNVGGSNQRYTPGSSFYYSSGNQNKTISSWLVFDKIPYGVSKVNVTVGDFHWSDLSVLKNEDPLILTDWTEEALRGYWQQNGLQEYEGIYEFAETSNPKWWGETKPLLAIKKEDSSYKVIYLADYGKKRVNWKEGHLKAEIRLTAVQDYYKVSWFADNGDINTNVQVEFADGVFALKSREVGAKTIFVRMFPGATAGSQNPGSGSIAPPSREGGVQAVYASQGSGIVIDKNGIIATNYHVIANRSSYEIVVKDGYSVKTYKTKLLVADKINDLALLQIDDKEFKQFTEMPFVIKSDICEAGTSIFSMGYPLSQYMGEEVKITDGIISSITGFQGDVVTYQISAPIQPGSSGGPLFDKNGNLVGITNAGISAAQNVGYAIKSTYLRLLIQSSPIKINTPSVNKIANLSLADQIKQLSKFVVIVKAK